MAEAQLPHPVKLICGMIAAERGDFDDARWSLTQAFGPIDLTSEIWPFDFTDYYAEEMGSPLLRQFVAFENLVSPDVLPAAKVHTNEIERDFVSWRPGGPKRPVNLDVGYLTPARLILASMKDFAHRVYVGQGVYAEVTIQFRDGEWRPLEWTFPDYASGRYDAFLTLARQRLCEQLHPETQG